MKLAKSGGSEGEVSLEAMGHVTALLASPQVPGGVQWALRYEPRYLLPGAWTPDLQVFVVQALIDLMPIRPSESGRYAIAVTRLSAWCVDEGIELDREIVFDPDTVERFTSDGLPGRSRRYMQNYRSLLRRIGRELTRDAPWEPDPRHYGRQDPSAGYSEKEVQRYLRLAESQHTTLGRRVTKAMLLLGVAAGLDGRWEPRVRASDIVALAEGFGVRVGPPYPRVVPVLARFEDQLVELAQAIPPDALLLGGNKPTRGRPSLLADRMEQPPDIPCVSIRRLRNTWITSHLTLGTRLPELIRAAGITTVSRLDLFFPGVAPISDEETIWQLRGRP